MGGRICISTEMATRGHNAVLLTLASAKEIQLIALGALGDHGHHVQGHVVGAHRIVGELKLHKVMVEQNAQDPQMKPDHATQIAAQLQSCTSCVAVVTLTAPIEVAKTVGAAIPPAVVLLVQHNLYLYLATRAG